MHPLLARLNNKTTRTILRIVLFLLILFGVSLLLTVVVGFAIPHTFDEDQIDLYLSPAVSLAAAAVAHYVMLRAFDRRPWSAVGLGCSDAHPRLLGGGLLIGIAAIGIPSLLLLATSQLKLIPVGAGSSGTAAALGILTFLPAAFFEELMMRGYLFLVLREAFGWKAALIFTSVTFGLLHMANPNVDPESIALVIMAGFFLGAVLLATGSLFATGMAHFGWNWVMGSLMHASVSGIDVFSPDFRIVDNGPDWLTGGAWGPEGGLAAGVGMMISFIYLYARRLRRMES
ncbi:MAG: CPBP family intramembrane metalloprotease [Gemmatimonadaceae bacterium]|nr:CPBP family intramembrane metalloprotease [Gemmatimonadaceae bacterium]